MALSLSSGQITLTGSDTADLVTVDHQAAASGKPDRFELTAGSGTSFPGAPAGCSYVSATNVYCPSSSVTGFVANMADGDDRITLGDEDPARGTETFSADFGGGHDRLATFLPIVGVRWADPVTAAGGDGDDQLDGGTGADSLSGGAGADALSGGGGGDSLGGQGGADTLRGGIGDDALSGGSGDDALLGEDGDDTLTPGTGADDMDGGGGTDTASYAERIAIPVLGISPSPVTASLDGNANDGAPGENDNIRAAVENLTGGGGDDVLIGDDAANALLGSAGNDVLHGAGGPDVLDGGAGDDSVLGGAGGDDLRDGGEGGSDTVDYSDHSASVRVDLAGGGAMGPEADADLLAPSFENITGGAGDDDLTGSPGANALRGGPGADLLDALAGADHVDGGEGADRLSGGDGNDSMGGSGGNDLVDGGGGSDPRLDGGDGADVVMGGPGGPDDADVLTGGQGRDQITYEGRASGVGVTMNAVADDGAVGERDDVGSDFEGVVGGEGPDVLVLTAPVRLALIFRPIIVSLAPVRASAAAAQMVTVEPGRFVHGRGGNDSIQGSAGNDALTGGLGRDKIVAGAGNDGVHGGSGDDSVDGGDGNDRVYGDEGNDVIRGGKGLDVLLSADARGRDRSECGPESDTLLRDVRDGMRSDDPCERTLGLDSFRPAPGVGNVLDGDEMFGPDGDDVADVDGDGVTGSDDWFDDFATDDFDAFGAGFDDDFFGFDDFGEFGDAEDIAEAMMELATKRARLRRNAFRLRLACPKAATRRCVGEVAVMVKPRKGPEKRVAVALFRARKGSNATLKLKLRARLRKLVPKGRKGVRARVVVEARDGGDLLFGLDQQLALRR